MSGPTLTEQERTAFWPEIARNRALDYQFVFENVPLQFVYRDKPSRGELTDLERRNKAITETVWLDAYHQYLVANVGYRYLYRGAVLQMVHQVHQVGAGAFSPPAEEQRPFLGTVEAVQASFDAWMANTGWALADDLRQAPARGSWQSLLGAPDRTVRIVSLLPVGNQVVLELITTWTEDDVLHETAWAVVLLYDSDGTVLQDRSYIELANWPSVRGRERGRAAAPPAQAPSVGVGVMDRFYEYHRSRRVAGALSAAEQERVAIIEGSWVDDWNAGRTPGVLHPDRYRMQLPQQKVSFNLETARAVDAIVKEAAPDRTMRLGLTYAKGSQVAAEGVVSWTENGVDREAPFLSLLLLDDEGRVIRDRRYLTLANWPGAGRARDYLGI